MRETERRDPPIIGQFQMVQRTLFKKKELQGSNLVWNGNKVGSCGNEMGSWQQWHYDYYSTVLTVSLFLLPSYRLLHRHLGHVFCICFAHVNSYYSSIYIFSYFFKKNLYGFMRLLVFYCTFKRTERCNVYQKIWW